MKFIGLNGCRSSHEQWTLDELKKRVSLDTDLLRLRLFLICYNRTRRTRNRVSLELKKESGKSDVKMVAPLLKKHGFGVSHAPM